MQLSWKSPSLSQVNLANSSAVTDEWIEVLSTTHADSLQCLDFSGCQSISCTQASSHLMDLNFQSVYQWYLRHVLSTGHEPLFTMIWYCDAI